MRKLTILSISCLLFVNCVSKVFLQGVDSCTEVIIPEYRAYIKNDVTLDSTTKRIRVQTIDKLEELIEAAKGEE